MLDGYSRLDIQMMMVSAIQALQDVLDGNRPGRFEESALREIKNIADSFDKNELNAFIKESESYDNDQLKNILNLCKTWMSLLELEIPKPTDSIIQYHIKPYYQKPVYSRDAFLENLVINVDQEDIQPNNENGSNYWLLTDDGYLEFHGGGYLRNSHGEIMSSYNGHDPIGKEGIQGGLTEILERAMDGAELTDEYVIGLMTEANMRFRAKNPDDIHDMDNWYWDLRENLGDNENRRIKLPDEVVEYYKQFEPGWKHVEGGFIGADYTNVAGANVKYHVGVDWVWRENNLNKTEGVNLLSTTAGTIDYDIMYSGGTDGKGNYIRINCDDGSRIDYFHMESVNSSLKPGNMVSVGTILGKAGRTGTRQAHLHIAKSYIINDDFDEKGLEESEYDGSKLSNNQYLRYISKETGKEGNLRAYVTPPEPIISEY